MPYSFSLQKYKLILIPPNFQFSILNFQLSTPLNFCIIPTITTIPHNKNSSVPAAVFFNR
jgi:hypothetical protein